METNSMTPEQALACIQSMVQQKKAAMKEDAFTYLVWGSLGLLAALIHYAMLRFSFYPNFSALAWPVCMSTAGIIMRVHFHNKPKPVVTELDKMIREHWKGFFYCLLVTLSCGFNIGWNHAYTFILALYGWGLFGSGRLLRFFPLVLGGIICWFLALVSMNADFLDSLLLIALAMVAGYLIPGFWLYFSRPSNVVSTP